VVAVGHTLDISTAPALKAELFQTVAAGASQLVVEIEPRCQIDSSGLAVLVAVHKRLERLGGRLIVVIRDRHIASKLEALGLDRVLTLAGSRAEALAGMGPA